MIEPTANVDMMAKLARPGPAGAIGAGQGSESFAQALQEEAQTHGRPAARQAVTELIATALLVPVLDAMFERPLAEA